LEYLLSSDFLGANSLTTDSLIFPSVSDHLKIPETKRRTIFPSLGSRDTEFEVGSPVT